MVDFGVVLAHLPRLLEGARTTVLISAAALFFGALCGLAICALRLSRHAPLRWFTAAFISVFRGIPLLVVLLMVFYVPAAVGIETTPLTAALIAMSLNAAAYQAEIYRAGYSTVPPAHVEAARILGFTRPQIARHILLPQILRKTLPALVGDAIDVVKSSGLVSIIAVTDLLRVSQQIVSVTYRPLEVYLACGAMYLVLSLALAQAGQTLERRWAAR